MDIRMKKVNSYMQAAPTVCQAADFAMSSNDHEYKFGESVKYLMGIWQLTILKKMQRVWLH